MQLHTSGRSLVSAQTRGRPATPISTSAAVQLLSVSASVIPLILHTTQNPLSFIHDPTFDPHPITITR